VAVGYAHRHVFGFIWIIFYLEFPKLLSSE
jgi:hypothetical protein